MSIQKNIFNFFSIFCKIVIPYCPTLFLLFQYMRLVVKTFKHTWCVQHHLLDFFQQKRWKSNRWSQPGSIHFFFLHQMIDWSFCVSGIPLGPRIEKNDERLINPERNCIGLILQRIFLPASTEASKKSTAGLCALINCRNGCKIFEQNIDLFSSLPFLPRTC